MQVNVASLVGENAITVQDGQTVYEQIFPALGRSEAVVLDFGGVAVFASPFFNAAVGQLLKDFAPEHLNTFLRVEQLNPLGMDVCRQVVANSRRYYTDPHYRQSIDEVWGAVAEET